MATVRIPDDLWARIQERAATQRRSATAELAAIVEWALSNLDEPRKKEEDQ